MFNLHELFKVSAGVGAVLRANGSARSCSKRTMYTHKSGLLLVDVRPFIMTNIEKYERLALLLSRAIRMLLVIIVIKHFFLFVPS